MKILVTGSDGMLGHAVMKTLEGMDATPVTMHDFDITQPEPTAAFIQSKAPSAVINCAAYTNVDGCETSEAEAFAVNAQGVKNLADACRKIGATLFHISTDYVFDGTANRPYTEQDPTNPLSAYGRSKLQGEQFLQAALQEHVIIRTQWLYGSNGKHFAGRILQLARERDTLEVVNDQIGSPTCTTDLARAIAALLRVPSARGIYHATNAGACSWFDFARAILRLTGSPTRVLPISSERLARPARRPAYSVFDCSRLIRETGHRPQPWDQALEQYLHESHPQIR